MQIALSRRERRRCRAHRAALASHGFLSDQDQRRLTCALQNMRMSCNSTYLLDQGTDHGVKADELVALLDELFAEPDAKAVVFSQWLRMHEIVIRRFEARGWGHVLFHGGVPSNKRPALVDRFAPIPAAALFLVHRRGQHGTEPAARLDAGEHGPAVESGGTRAAHRAHSPHGSDGVRCRSSISSPRAPSRRACSRCSLSSARCPQASSMAASGEISLGGSRLSRFMKEVENVTVNMGESQPITPVEEKAGNILAAADAAPRRNATADANIGAARTNGGGTPSRAGADPWQALVQAGAQFITAFAAANDPGSATHPWIECDPSPASGP